ncbi:MAG TPA: hypothetical protein VI136_19795 [Verrucomicrobiae bacterium]
MELVFVILGQSAVTAAAFALEDHFPAQKVNCGKLRARLSADRQVLNWTASRKTPSG